jgi:hypothetical protein
MSCASPTKGRFSHHGIEHCGYCVPCLIRRAALKKALGREDPTSYTLRSLAAETLDTRHAQGRQIRSFQLALLKLKATPGIERLLIHKTGPLRDETSRLLELADVYRRGVEEVGSILTRVSTKPG